MSRTTRETELRKPSKTFPQMHAGIIGGGPAGALAGLLLARQGMKVSIFEPRPIKIPRIGEKIDPCVGCAGLLQENAIALLESVGLSLPEEIIQTKLKKNCIHFSSGETIQIPTCAMTVYRSFGPAGGNTGSKRIYGFDTWLMKEAEKAGAYVIESAVTRVRSDGERVFIESSHQVTEVDFALASYGHNRIPLDLPPQGKRLGEPVTQPACVREYYLGEEIVKDRLKESQHVFGNPTANIWYASIFPKGAYISIAIMGRDGATQGDFKEFFALRPVQNLVGNLGSQKLSCGCTSSITIRSPQKSLVRDRNGGFLVAKIGDAGATRPRKNGIFAALDSAVKFADTIRRYGNTPRAVRVFERYMTVNYVWDNWPSQLVMRFLDLFLNHTPPRRFIIYLCNGNVPLISKAVNKTLELVLTGKIPYWQIPFRVIFNYPKDPDQRTMW